MSRKGLFDTRDGISISNDMIDLFFNLSLIGPSK